MSKGLKIGLVGAIVVLFLGVAGLAYMVLMRPAPAAAATTTEHTEPSSEAAHLEFLKLKNFVTDLADKDRARYVDVTVAVGLKDAAGLTEAKALENQVRDAILTQLRTRTAADLLGAPGKDKLAEAIKESLGKLLKDHLKAVYITDLVVQ
ncbi:MAG TPA: flagellar basal body-associated FliL family protein [Symbiobacteriaceae bacterium]|nr:flagellar basal body-associated FliL family protein [Symbiobacteriaceae bacterium]